jgi:hypothetical protein
MWLHAVAERDRGGFAPAGIREARCFALTKEDDMCVSCGCGEPNADHGDSRNITMRDVEAAASAAGVNPSQVADNIKKEVPAKQ